MVSRDLERAFIRSRNKNVCYFGIERINGRVLSHLDMGWW